jgi:methylenetetrahydrofolate reductase (NADPH)
MKIAEILKRRKRGFCFEFFPPKTEAAMLSFLGVVRELSRLDPLYVSVPKGILNHHHLRRSWIILERR